MPPSILRVREHAVVPSSPEISFYRPYIDDDLIIWSTTDEGIDHQWWTDLKNSINDFGADHPFFSNNDSLQQPLILEFSERDKTTVFLDLDLAIEDGKITSKIFEKEVELTRVHPSTFMPLPWCYQRPHLWLCEPCQNTLHPTRGLDDLHP